MMRPFLVIICAFFAFNGIAQKERLVAMIQEGNMDAAAKISERMNSLSSTTVELSDSWGLAVNYLDELEKLAYSTQIVIDKQR
ncbi:MAG: hypothetical protein IH946_05680 [Bacteroidetes bacterium]|nr:hypothetical protein [Bacteroidota bacterium]